MDNPSAAVLRGPQVVRDLRGRPVVLFGNGYWREGAEKALGRL